MKFQDILFFLVFAGLLYKHNPKHFVVTGLLCILIAMPLFAKWVFFTAQHLVWYSAAFFLAAIVLYLFSKDNFRKG